MPLARSRFRARRHEFARAHGPLNLVPLVDILTAIVFFSLLSAVSLRSALASFDLVAPPAVAEGEVGNAAAFAQLRHSLASIMQALGRRAAVTVVPSDDVAYDDVIHVLEQI